MGSPSSQNLLVGGGRFIPVDIEQNLDLKTSFKDNKNNDDETTAPFSEFLEKISAACKKVTGKPTTKREREK